MNNCLNDSYVLLGEAHIEDFKLVHGVGRRPAEIHERDEHGDADVCESACDPLLASEGGVGGAGEDAQPQVLVTHAAAGSQRVPADTQHSHVLLPHCITSMRPL
jgi:hypothetical protein